MTMHSQHYSHMHPLISLTMSIGIQDVHSLHLSLQTHHSTTAHYNLKLHTFRIFCSLAGYISFYALLQWYNHMTDM